MNVEYVAVDAPEHCARCMGTPTHQFDIQVGKHPKRSDNMVKFSVRICDDCRRRIRRALIAFLGSVLGFVLIGLVWSMIYETAAPIVIAGVAAIVTMLVTGPVYQKAHPQFLDEGPVRFRNTQYNSTFVSRNAAFIKQLNAARREAVMPRRGEVPPLLQSVLRGGVYVGLFAAVVGFRAPEVLIGGIALALVCGGVLVVFSAK